MNILFATFAFLAATPADQQILVCEQSRTGEVSCKPAEEPEKLKVSFGCKLDTYGEILWCDA